MSRSSSVSPRIRFCWPGWLMNRSVLSLLLRDLEEGLIGEVLCPGEQGRGVVGDGTGRVDDEDGVHVVGRGGPAEQCRAPQFRADVGKARPGRARRRCPAWRARKGRCCARYHARVPAREVGQGGFGTGAGFGMIGDDDPDRQGEGADRDQSGDQLQPGAFGETAGPGPPNPRRRIQTQGFWQPDTQCGSVWMGAAHENSGCIFAGLELTTRVAEKQDAIWSCGLLRRRCGGWLLDLR